MKWGDGPMYPIGRIGHEGSTKSMVITDRYDHAIDEKNRLAIPSAIRNAMDPQVDGTRFYLVPEGRYLQLIPEKLFEQMAVLATAGLQVPSEIAKARRLIFATTSKVEPDKQGRIIIPDRFMADSKNRDPYSEAVLGREVTLVGVGDRIEVWNRQDFVSHLRELMADRPAVQAAGQKMFQSLPGQPVSGSQLPI